MALNGLSGFEEVLRSKQSELVRVLQERGGISIERSADPMDEIQSATERDLAIGNVDRESTLLRHVRAALARMHDGSFGECMDCEEEISAKRLKAVPWASRCIRCQEAADRDGSLGSGTIPSLVEAA